MKRIALSLCLTALLPLTHAEEPAVETPTAPAPAETNAPAPAAETAPACWAWCTGMAPWPATIWPRHWA